MRETNEGGGGLPHSKEKEEHRTPNRQVDEPFSVVTATTATTSSTQQEGTAQTESMAHTRNNLVVNTAINPDPPTESRGSVRPNSNGSSSQPSQRPNKTPPSSGTGGGTSAWARSTPRGLDPIDTSNTTTTTSREINFKTSRTSPTVNRPKTTPPSTKSSGSTNGVSTRPDAKPSPLSTTSTSSAKERVRNLPSTTPTFLKPTKASLSRTADDSTESLPMKEVKIGTKKVPPTSPSNATTTKTRTDPATPTFLQPTQASLSRIRSPEEVGSLLFSPTRSTSNTTPTTKDTNSTSAQKNMRTNKSSNPTNLSTKQFASMDKVDTDVRRNRTDNILADGTKSSTTTTGSCTGHVSNTYCPNCGDQCTCGDNCMCSEELCQCQAYQVLHSISPNKKSIIQKKLLFRTNDNKSSSLHTPEADTSCAELIVDDPLAQQPSHGDNHVAVVVKHCAELLVHGMSCAMCVQAIETALHHQGVMKVSITLTTDSVYVEWKDPVQLKNIRDAIEEIGYSVEEVRIVPSSDNQINHVTTESTDIEESVEERWERYRKRQDDKVGQRRNAFLWALVGTLPLVILTMILPQIIPNLFHHKQVHLPVLDRRFDLEALILWILATPVQFLCGFEFYRMAWYGFISGTTGMDLLVALGTTASYGYALNGAWNGDEHAAHFFETSVVLICFVLAGKWMQAAAVRRTGEALTQLMELQSPTAMKVTPFVEDTKEFNPLTDPYREEVVDIRLIMVGDVVKVIRGASIPADGQVLFGEISVDESMVTGESIPILKSPGSFVLGGTICVESGVSQDTDISDKGQNDSVGAAFIKVTGVGSSTALSQIIELVQRAQTQTVPIQAFADQVSAVFVPAVCTVSLVTYLVWYALCASNVVPEHWYREELGEGPATFSLMFAIACLVISCPCALGLATPTAVMVGTGVGARCGVLMKGGETLEIASKVDSVLFDKTGTLTVGKPAVTDFIRLSKQDKAQTLDDSDDIADHDYLLWLLGSLERTSEHPLARAIVNYAEEQLGEALEDNPFVQPSNFRGLTGRGASGTILGRVSVAVGNRTFASVQNIAVPTDADELMQRLEEDGKTAILVALNESVCAVLGIADQLKSDASASIIYLRDKLGVDVWMVTGDNARTAAAISRKLGLSPNRVISEALPAAKLEKVRVLQNAGRVVAMVGDGVNDSPALAQADVGMSLGTGAEIALEASDLVLVKGHVSDVCTALHLSRAIFSRIRWNLFWSLLYNCLGIPIAAGALYPFFHARLPPTLAAVAMALSSVSVVLSSLTLRFYQPPDIDEDNLSHRRSIMDWIRSMNGRISSQDEVNEMRVNLLQNDHLANSEETERIDNRTIARMEEG